MCSAPPATRRPRARVVVPRLAQLALRRDQRSSTRRATPSASDDTEKECHDAVVADGADGRSSRPP
eukprot:107236-Prymnesium_polylepis.1